MNIAKEIFERKRPNLEAMIKYGFTVDGDELYYREFFKDELAAEIRVSRDGRILCKAIDTETGDEYSAINVEAQVGEYVGTARELYRSLLKKIARDCCEDVDFISDQANRIAALIRAEFRRKPEFIFAKDPRIGVFRHGHNGKWFSIVMPVPRGRLEGGEISGDPAEIVDVMNVKTDPQVIEELIKTEGIYRCYHMNKKQWITITLDDSLPDEYIMSLVCFSHELTKRGTAVKRKRRGSGASKEDWAGNLSELSEETEERRFWIIPSNPKYYDVDKGFRDSGCDTLIWHQRIQALPGDIVYIYQAEPVGSIRFRCEVEKASLPRQNRSGMAPTATELMYLHRTDTYEKGVYTRAWMNQHGIAKTIRGQRSAPDELVDIIERETAERKRTQ